MDLRSIIKVSKIAFSLIEDILNVKLLSVSAVACECHSNPAQNVPASETAVGKIDYVSGTDNNYNYPQNANCHWLITAPESKCIR